MSAARRRHLDRAGRECADALLPAFLKNPDDLVANALALQREMNTQLARLEPVSDAEHLRAMDAYVRRMRVHAAFYDRRRP